MAGLTATGLVVLTAQEVRDEINAAVQEAFGPSVDVSDNSILGQLIAIWSEREATQWELLEAINASQDPDAAIGAFLEAIGALTGTIRLPATSSAVTLTLTGTAATLVPAASRASVSVTLEQFATDEDATLVLLTAWAPTTAYVIGDRRSNSGNCYVCTADGTSAGSGGPTTTDPTTPEVDGSASWRFMGAGLSAVDVEASSVNTGPIVGVALSILTIETPVAGWDAVINLLDATEGRDIETDEDFRVRRETELAAPGTSPVDAVRSDLLDVPDVTTVSLFVNNSDVTDPDGVPPHAIEALIEGGDDQAIWDKLLASVAAGIQTHGTEVGSSTDSEGTSYVMKFSRPTPILVYVDIEVTVDANSYPLDGDDQIKAAIVAYGDAQPTGRDVVSTAIISACFSVAGVLDVTVADIGTAPDPSSSATIAIDPRELAIYDTTRITVVDTPGTP